jgi:DNA ligase-1
VARVAVTEGEAALGVFRIELFRPVQPMLAQTAESVAGALSGGKSRSVEYKLDGARIQVHRSGTEVRIFTRNSNDVTARVPEIVDLARSFRVNAFILDGEAIALRADGRPLPFQVTMSRFGRRLEVEATRREVPLRAFFFDCLHAAGEDLIGKKASERIQVLDAVIGECAGVRRLITADPALAEAFLSEAQREGHEGVMVKDLDAPYEAGRRGAAWLKVKSAITLDLVVLAVEWGSGRRKGLLSNLHLGARDPEGGGFVMLGKTFKGMTDQMLAFQTERLLCLETSRDAYTVYVRPELVVEIAFDGVQRSSQYPGGMALRFARVKGYRVDKTPAEADTIGTVRGIYERSLGSGAAEDLDDERDREGDG